MTTQPTDLNLQQLEVIEQQIGSALQSAGQSLSELSKDKPSLKQVENHSMAYMKALDAIEDGLSTHINYLTQCSTGQPHEGSCYAAQNDLHMAHFRWEHVRSRLGELEKMKTEHVRQQTLQRSMGSQFQGAKVNIGVPSQQQGAAPAIQQQMAPQPMDTGGASYSDVSSS